MSGYEYKVVPAPQRGLKAKGIKGTQARFANALQTVMNEHGAEGWEYQRTDTLPVEERQGLTGKTTSFQNMLIFRRSLTAPVEVAIDAHAEIAAAPVETAPEAEAETDDAQARIDEALRADPVTAPSDDTPVSAPVEAEGTEVETDTAR